MRVESPFHPLPTDWANATEPVPGFRIGRAVSLYWAVARSGHGAFAYFTTYEEAANEARRMYDEDGWEEKTHTSNT